MTSRSSNLKICPALKTKQTKFFYYSSPKERDPTPAKCQTKKPKYHPIPSFPLPSISSHQVVSVVLLKYCQVIYLFISTATGMSNPSLPLNSCNSILADLPVSTLVLLYSVSTGSNTYMILLT